MLNLMVGKMAELVKAGEIVTRTVGHLYFVLRSK